MEIINNILKKNPCYKAGKTIKVKGLMLHSVGCPQPSAAVFIRNWNKESYRTACVHAFVDANTGEVYQTLPWNYRGWHSGGSGNNTHIGVEMCEPDCIQYKGGSTFTCSDKARAGEMVRRTYQATVELFAYLCKLYSLKPMSDGVILSHSEGYKRGIATNHGDPEHLWKGLGLPYTMDGFRRDVWSAMQEENESGAQDISETKEYLVRIRVSDLNIRKGPGTNFERTGRYTGVGTFTIVEEADGLGASKWGRLKSGAGWISLDYTERMN